MYANLDIAIQSKKIEELNRLLILLPYCLLNAAILIAFVIFEEFCRENIPIMFFYRAKVGKRLQQIAAPELSIRISSYMLHVMFIVK